ncbi:MAG: hypothetical protein ACOYN0_05100 [Phycisphaerales bacterium]
MIKNSNPHFDSARVTTAAAAVLLCAGLASAQIPAMTMTPAQPIAPAAAEPPQLSDEELDEIAEQLKTATPEERASIVAMFKDMGIDVEAKLAARAGGAAPDGAAGEKAAPPKQTLMQVFQTLDFTRTPQAVLAARSRLGFAAVEKPSVEKADEAAKWLHMQVMAGEWETFGAFLKESAGKEAPAIYSHVLQALNKPGRGEPGKSDPALLPEEVLAVGDACPEELADYQLDILSQLLKAAAGKYSTAPMLARINEGTKQFSKADEKSRTRTIRFLAGAGLVMDAYGYLPSIDEARSKGDAGLLLNHAKYFEGLAAAAQDEDAASDHRREAWKLYGEITLLDKAKAELRQEAMKLAIDLLPLIPPAEGREWLARVFGNATLGPAALEAITLKAVSLRDGKLEVAQRAQAILTMKESVDTLLAQSGMDINVLRVPLRMLTTALVNEAEQALADREKRRGRGASRELELLLRALPDERWIGALEPSLASRAYRAAIGVATASDETDLALEYVAQAVKRFPGDGQALADFFLGEWKDRLSPPGPDPNEENMFFYFGRQGLAAAPLTRGRQRRDLDRLTKLMVLLDGAGVDSRRLPSVAEVFHACHGATEVFTREGIESVFGKVETLPPETAASLADQMRGGLSGDWRDRRAQQSAGNKRTPAEITKMVERGYELAIELVERSIAAKPDSWRFAVTKAALTYDRLQYKQAEQKQDFAAFNQYRKEAFLAFAQTADRYADQVRAGQERTDPGVFLAWFNAAVGATELNYLTREDLLVEGSPQDDQIDLIRKAMQSMPEEAASRHIGEFARAMGDSVPRLAPEVKPRVIRHALRIIGDHPSGAPLRRLGDLYNDLVKDEVKLRLSVDGDDSVGSGKRFGATLSMRFTAAVDRETGGFSRYLQNDVWTRVGNQYQPVNHRDILRKSIEDSLSEHFQVDSVGFFEPLAPPRPVTESGQDGWLEKPMAYVVLRAKDPSTDRLPALNIDLYFNDALGPVTLPLISNAPPLDASKAGGTRPVRKLEVVQALDVRLMNNPDKGRVVTLEVRAKGQGVLPELDELLPGYKTALAGYEIVEKGIDARPVTVVQDDGDWDNNFWGRRRDDKQEYAEADEAGFYRLTTERSWMITYSPTGGGVGSEFALPSLSEQYKGDLVSKQYADMDLVTLTSKSVPVEPRLVTARNGLIAVLTLGAVSLGGVLLWRSRRKPALTTESSGLPDRVTPLSVISYLRRAHGEVTPESAVHAELSAEIARLERIYFGPGGSADDKASEELGKVLGKWSAKPHAARR